MHTRAWWRWLAGLALGLSLTSCARSGPGSPAPDFSLQGLDGQRVSLSSLAGKVVFLDFWATWCGPCREALPHTQRMTNREVAQSGQLVVLAVNRGEPRDEVNAFFVGQGFDLKCLLDTDQRVGAAYGVHGIPHFVVIGADGKIRWEQSGWSPQVDEEIDRQVSAALQEVMPGR